jgi:hypothetical protein
VSEKPHRVQLSRKKGWRMPPNTVSVARPTKWGNPWTTRDARQAGYAGNDLGLRAWCKKLYREWMSGDTLSLTRMLGGGEGEVEVSALRTALPELRGKNLACFCPLDQPCHADVLLELANK